MMNTLAERIVDRLAGSNILVAFGVARDDNTMDVHEDDHVRPGHEIQADDAAANDHDS